MNVDVECEHVKFIVSGLHEKAQMSYSMYDCPWCAESKGEIMKDKDDKVASIKESLKLVRSAEDKIGGPERQKFNALMYLLAEEIILELENKHDDKIPLVQC